MHREWRCWRICDSYCERGPVWYDVLVKRNVLKGATKVMGEPLEVEHGGGASIVELTAFLGVLDMKQVLAPVNVAPLEVL